MLTVSEKLWLADSEYWNFKFDIYGNSSFCPSCKYCKYLTETANGVFCQDAEDMRLYDKLSKCPLVPSKELLHEAAAFEGRVAARLATIAALVVGEDCCETRCPVNDCPVASRAECMFYMLKYARLEVEEEMDGNSNV